MMKITKIIEKRKAVEKARVEYHSFMSVRLLKDITSSVNLMKVMLRLEKNLVEAVNKLNRILNGVK